MTTFSLLYYVSTIFTLLDYVSHEVNRQVYTTFTNFSTKYIMMCKVYTDVGGIK